MKQYLKKEILLMGMLLFSILITPVALSAESIKSQNDSEFTAPIGTSDEWEASLAVYMWGAGIDAKNSDDDNTHISFDDIMDNLDMAVMTAAGVRKDKLSLIADLIYLDLGNDSSPTEVDLTMKAFIATTAVGYTVVEAEEFRLDLIAGVRYLYLDIELGVPGSKYKDSGHNFDAIIGIRGDVGIADRWSLNYYLDGGTGDTHFTTMASTFVTYKLEDWNFGAGYRYLKWDFQDSSEVNSIVVQGPFAGVDYKF